MNPGLRLLYVDDEPALLEIGKLFLEVKGEFSVDTLTSAQDAFDRVKSVPYDAIISDYQMPDMDGIQFLKHLRASGNTTPFIIFTGRGREEIVIEALNAGADFYLQKGGEPKSQFAELAHNIRQAIQQRRSLASIRNHERREADIINFLPDATFAIDRSGVVIAWNRAIERMTGIGSEEMLGRGDYEYALPFYDQRRPMLIDLVLQEDPVAAETYSPITRDGTTLVCEVTIPHFNNGEGAALWFTASPLYDLGGTVVGAIESIREITERKRADEALAWSEKRFRELSDLLPQIVYEMAPDGTLTYANHIAFEQFGYAEDEIRQGLNVIQMIVPVDQDRARADIRHMFEGQERTRLGGEYLAVRKNGGTFPIAIYSSPVVVNDRIAGIRGIIVDMTERKQAEEALASSEARLRRAEVVAGLGHWEYDLESRNMYASDGARTLYGLAGRQWSISEVQKLPLPEYRPILDEALRNLVEHNRRYDVEFRIQRPKDGKILDIHSMAEYDPSKRTVFGVIQDITERRQAEERLSEINTAFLSFGSDPCDNITILTGLAGRMLQGTCALYNRLEGGMLCSLGMWNTPPDFIPCDRPEGHICYDIIKNSSATPTIISNLLESSYAETDPNVRRYQLKTYVGTPVQIGGKSLGSLCVLYQDTCLPSRQDLEILSFIGQAIAIEDGRRTARQGLLESEERFRSLAENLQDAVIILGFDGSVQYLNNAASLLAGIPPSGKEETVNIASFLAPESQQRAMADLEMIRVGDGPLMTEYQVRTVQGELRWVEAVSIRIPWQGIDRDLVSLRDITWRKQAEQELQHQNRSLETINQFMLEFASLPQGQSVAERAVQKLMEISGAIVGAFSLYNPSDRTLQTTHFEMAPGLLEKTVRLLGKRPKEMKIPVSTGMYQEIVSTIVRTKKTLTEMSFGHIHPLVSASIQSLTGIDHFIGIAYVIEGELNGTSLLAIKHGQSDPSPEILESLAHIVSVSLRRDRAEATLRESEERLALVIDGVPALLAYVDADLRYVYVNQAYADWYCLNRQEIIGKDIRDLLEEEVFERALPQYQTVLSGSPVFFENQTLDGKGRERSVSVRLTPHFSGQRVVGLFAAITDITENRQAEEALRQSDLLLQEIFDNANDGIFLVERTPYGPGKYLLVNDKAVQMLGYSKEELLTMSPRDVVPGDVQKKIMPIVLQKLIKDGHATFESQNRRKDGSVFPIEVSAHAFPYRGKNVDLSIIRDITERKKAEEALRQSDLLLHEVFDNANDAIFLLERTPDGPGKYLLVNDKAVRMLGYSKEEFLQMSPRDIVPEDVQKRIMPQVIQELLREGHATFESVHRRKDGSTYPIEVSTHTFRYRGKDVDLSIVREITERKKAEEALAESEEKFRNIIAQANDGVLLVDETGSIQVWNRSLQSITGLSEEEVIGTALWDIEFQLTPQTTREIPVMYSQIRERVLSQFKEKEATEVNRSQVQEILRPDGTSRIIQMFEFSIKKDRKNLLCAFVRDITEQKHAEDALRQVNRKLTLLSGITRHDINNQLTMLQGYLSLLEPNQLDPLSAEYFRKAATAAERISAMIQFTREYESIGVHAPAWQNCRTLVETAADQVPLGQVVVKNTIPAGFEVFADPLIVRVCYNLMDNAVRYGGKITTVRFSVEGRDGRPALICEDDGDGVAAAEKMQIFDKGFGKNTGFGLAISREILDITGIAIRETGEPGKGARFEITIPPGMFR